MQRRAARRGHDADLARKARQRALARLFEQAFAPQAEAKGLALEFACAPGVPGLVMLDGDRLRQMLFNLMGNAVKFTDQGRVSVALSYGAGQLEAAE